MADMDLEELDEIVLVGGATYTPYIRETLQQIFDGVVINTGMNPMLVKNVTPLTISVVGKKYNSDLLYCRPIFKRNTVYPAEENLCATTSAHKQTKCKIIITEGEHRCVEKNNEIGTIFMDGLTG